MPSLRLLLQLPSTRVLALLRVPQLLLPQVPVRLVRRRRDELAAQLQSKKMQRPRGSVHVLLHCAERPSAIRVPCQYDFHAVAGARPCVREYLQRWVLGKQEGDGACK